MDRDEFRQELGRRLASGRRYRGFSQPELAEVTGLKKSSISPPRSVVQVPGIPAAGHTRTDRPRPSGATEFPRPT